MTTSTKSIGIVQIVDPSEMSSYFASEEFTPHAGAILCTCPGLGFLGDNLIYCRYGLAFPYLKVQKGWKVLIEPTIDGSERWFYTGLVDCGGAITPTDADQMILQFASQMIYASTAGKIHLSSKTASEPFVLGNALKTYIDSYIDTKYNTHTHLVSGVTSGGASVTSGVPTSLATKPASILSTKIMGE